MLIFYFALMLMQVFLLPGLVAMTGTRGLALSDRLLLAVPISFLVNYLMVVILVLLGYYTQFVMLCIAAAEISFLLMLYRNSALRIIDWKPSRGIISVSFNAFSLDSQIKLITFCSLLYLLNLSADQVGTVISDWDGVASWQRWALSWYSGKFPETVWSYPQVLPVLYSIAFKFLGSSSIWIAPKLIPIVIAAVIPITAIRLAYLLKGTAHLEILAAIPVFIYLSRHLVYPDYMFSGSAEMACAYFGLISVYCIALSKRVYGHTTDTEYNRIMFWLSVATATAPIVKQAAVFASALFSFGWYWVTRSERRPNRMKILLGIWLVAALIPLHWYLYIYITTTNPAGLATMYEQFHVVPWYLRPLNAWKMIVDQVGWWPVPFLLIGASLKKFRILLIPFFAVYVAWALYISYDVRGLYVALPLMSFFVAAGIIAIVNLAMLLLNSRVFRVELLTSRYARLFMLAIMIAPAYELSKRDYYPRVYEKSFRQQMKVGSEKVNGFLYDNFRQKYAGSGVKIATYYQMMKFVPGLDEFFYHVHCGTPKDFAATFINNDVKFILMASYYCTKEMVSYLDNGVAEGKFKLVYEGDGHRLLEILEPKNRCKEYSQLDPESSWGRCQ